MAWATFGGRWRDPGVAARVSAAVGDIAAAKAAAGKARGAWQKAIDDAQAHRRTKEDDKAINDASQAYHHALRNLNTIESKAFADAVAVIRDKEVPFGVTGEEYRRLSDKQWGEEDLVRLRSEGGAVGQAAQIMLDDRGAVRDFMPEDERRHDVFPVFARLDVSAQSVFKDDWASWDREKAVAAGDGRFTVADMDEFLLREAAERGSKVLEGVHLDVPDPTPIDRKVVASAAAVLALAWEERPEFRSIAGSDGVDLLDREKLRKIEDASAGDTNLRRAVKVILGAANEKRDGGSMFHELEAIAYQGRRDGKIGMEDLMAYAGKYDGELF